VMASSPRSDYSSGCDTNMSDGEFRSATPDTMAMPVRLSSLGLAPIKIPLNF
jgi:hypothetical protein